MEYKQVTRVNPKSGALERPWRNRDHFFVLGDPAKGEVRHHDQHAVKVDNYGEALELIQSGFSIRMSDGKSAPTLVIPSSLTISDEPVAELDALWTYSMPDVPFSKATLEKDIRAALLSYAAEIYSMAGQTAADVFIGFELDIHEIDQEMQADQIDLSRFNFARVVLAAYESAFRVGTARLISDEDVEDLVAMLGAARSRFGHRYPHPADDKNSPLIRTMLSAFLRWRIYDYKLFDDVVDHSTVESLAILAGMTEQAVRNSLAKDKLSPVKGKADYSAIIKWLENRRDFVPLREDERPQSDYTWGVLNHIRAEPIRAAFGGIHQRNQSSNLDQKMLLKLENEIADLVEHGEIVPAGTLRTYARCRGLNIDTFVVQFPKALGDNNRA